MEHQQGAMKQVISSLISVLQVLLFIFITDRNAVDQKVKDLGVASHYIKDLLVDPIDPTLKISLEKFIFIGQILL